MTLCNHSSRVYMDEYDLDGLIKVLQRRVDEGADGRYEGAKVAFQLLYAKSFRTQDSFMRAFDLEMEE